MSERKWVPCRAVNPRPEHVWTRVGEEPQPQLCIRPEGHDGSHRAAAYIPKTVWWRDHPQPHAEAATTTTEGNADE